MNKLIELHLKRISKTCIASNSLLAKEYAGFLHIFNEQLYRIVDLKAIVKCNSEDDLFILLNSYTSKLKQKVCKPVKSEHWGICRKAINLYVRDCYYNKPLNEHYNLERVANYLETPIDSKAMEELKVFTASVKKTSLTKLDKHKHKEWQIAASKFALTKGLPCRVDADLEIY